MRRAGATAREMLIAAAAAQWGVAASECRAANSVITHAPSGRTVTFGEVAEAAAKIAPPKDVKLKDAKDWRLIGQPTRRLDVTDKVLGKPIYGIDVRVPGMLHAALAQCPVFKGTLKSVDESKARRHEGRPQGRQAQGRGRGGRRQLVAGEEGARRADDRLGRRRERQMSRATASATSCSAD